MKKISLLTKVLGFVSYTALATLLLIESIGYFVFDNRYNWDLRYLYYSNNPIVNEFSTPKTFWKYNPNSDIRSIATYQRLFSVGIEYDCTYHTNKFGFIDTGEITNYADFLVLGDSFTEGQGGCPWLTKDTLLIDDHLSNFKLLNGGLQGVGILQFEQVLDYFEPEVSIENLIIIAISNDFKRGDASQWQTDSDCYLSGSCKKNDYWHYIPIDMSDEMILINSRERSYERGIDFIERFKRASFAYRLYSEYRVIFKNIFDEKSIHVDDNLEPYRANLAALERIKLRYPSLKIILVPQRDEVGFLGQKNMDSLVIERYLESNNYQFSWCDITSDDYFPLDGHPNDLGYKKLFGCLTETIMP
jgi:hypothetical protein